MAEWGGERPKAGGRVGTWPDGRASRRRRGARVVIRPDLLARFDPLVARLSTWIAAERGPGRLVHWLPVAFGSGIALYFTADHEPQLWAGFVLTILCGVIAFAARRRSAALTIALLITAGAAGFSAVTLKSALLAQPVLSTSAWNVEVAGYVEAREQRERSDRIVVRAIKVESPRIREQPTRVRVALRNGTAPPVGSYVTFRARLGPPTPPVRPGGYDFALNLYFQGIGATGFVLGAITTAPPPRRASTSLDVATKVAALRDTIDQRIRGAVAGDRGAIASALITGKRDAISEEVRQAMYVSSLAHVLAISGYHMAMVAGIAFFVLRGLLVVVPGLATRHPVKKWAAIGALSAAAFYLIMSGAAVATQRAFIMTAIVLIGVMADRPALTLRTLALAALALLVMAPEALLHPSFQMSFAATLALIAAYANTMLWSTRADTPRAARMALWGGRKMAALLLASAVAGLATLPYAAFHFHRISPFGVLANLLAMPILSAWVMPAGLMALVAMPFGFDGPLWRLMGLGIGMVIAAARWVASLPGADLRMPAFGTGALLISSAGLVLLCLMRTPLRWSGAVMALIGCVLALRSEQPDILIASDGQSVAVRGADGLLAVHRERGNAFVVEQWLTADGDRRGTDDPKIGGAIRCDDSACLAPLPDGRMVSFVRSPEAYAEDCRRAVLVVTPRPAPPTCKTQIIDRGMLQTHGAVSLRVDGDGFSMAATRPPDVHRPWMPTRASSSRAPPKNAPASRDATPRLEDLEEDEPAADSDQPTNPSNFLDSGRSVADEDGCFCLQAIICKPPPGLRVNNAGTGPPSCPGCAPVWAAGCGPHRRCSPAPVRSRRRGGGSA